jgi:dTDP-4-amino-4,6-dideoxygalactose transaminase
MVSNHGQSVRYYHDRIGVNSRLDSIQAAILRCKLPHLDTYCDARRAAADFYDNAFADFTEIKTPVREKQSTHVFHQYTLQLAEGFDRDALVDYLQARNIPCMIYYPVALHMQTAYRDARYTDGSFPVTESLVKSVFSLPMHTELTHEQLTEITTAVGDFIKNNRK